MKNPIVKSLVSALLAAVAICLATAILLLWLLPLFGTILADNRQTVKPVETKKTIILDPGHGGEDSGAVGVNGSYEKDLNLSLAFVMRDLLTLAGYTVIMTRETDELLYDPDVNLTKKSQDLKNRLNFEDLYPDAIFVSIHMNKFPVEKYSGLQVYYSPNNSQSRELASLLQSEVREKLQTDNKREIKPATSSIYILDHIRIPAVLVECGFLSNALEEALLRDEGYQRQLAMVLCVAIRDYLNDGSMQETSRSS
ncbi:MAG: N-acetylmuramoyl-L-alanine amidase [Eubacteriales bacterium]